MTKPKNSIVNDYLNRYAGSEAITLVGPLVDHALHFSDPVIFVDRGSIRREGGVGIVVGDGDSSDIPMDLLLDPHKDFSDLGFALGLVPDSIQRITMNGFLGGRRDHELFNFGEVFQLLKKRAGPVSVHFDQEVIALTAGAWKLQIKGLFSLMAIEATNVEMTGQCRYAITPVRVVQPLSSFGLSNIGEGMISIQADHPIFLLSEHILSANPA